MDDALRNRLLDRFDADPASVEDFREIVRALVSHLSHLDALEAEIMAWDAAGREPSQFERLRNLAWGFDEVGGMECRKRIFAGFVTAGGKTDGYGAEFLMDCALASGISADDTYKAMASVFPLGTP